MSLSFFFFFFFFFYLRGEGWFWGKCKSFARLIKTTREVTLSEKDITNLPAMAVQRCIYWFCTGARALVRLRMRWAVFIVCTWPNCLFPPLRIANMDNVRIRFLLVIRLMAFVHQEQHACTCSRYSLSWNYNIEPQRERTYLLTCAPNEDSISLRICAVWSESSLHVYRIKTVPSEDSDQTANMHADLNLPWRHMSEAGNAMIRLQ